MGLEDALGKAKDLLGEHADQVDGAIDKAADLLKDKAPDQADGVIDQVADKAKDLL